MKIPDEVRLAINPEARSIEQCKDEFRKQVLSEDYNIERILNKFLLFGTPYIYKDDEETYFKLKEEISGHFNIQQTQIYVVGSAKLGFSISPLKLFRDINDDSDIDIAIIDEKLFMDYWKNLYTFNINLVSRSCEEDRKYKKFIDYFFKGWIRPDLMPIKMSDEWFEYFKGLYRTYNRKIAVGIYKDNDFFMGYHKNNITNIRKELNNGI